MDEVINSTNSTGQSADPRWFNLAEEEKPKTISDVKQINNGESIIVRRNELKDIVEEPCLKACELLYDKNIQTVASSANGQNFGLTDTQNATITINYTSLSDDNKAIVKSLQEEKQADEIKATTGRGRDGTSEFFIFTPMTKSSTVE
ncbi:hypothetical protein IKZ77_03735 [Candidatus Saccharibacteria bacterium]|nr:hypothetical protein [Candidatus Saccharibacteria bacterium]